MKLENVTQIRRSYADACGTAHALDLVGERWALLVIRELLLGPRRFGDLRGSLPGLSANVLTQRLEDLEAVGVVRRRRLPPPASVQVYELTQWGLEAEEAIRVLGRWGARSPFHDPSLPLSGVSLMLSFRTMFDAERGDGSDVAVAFRHGHERFIARVRDRMLDCGRDDGGLAELEVTGTPPAVAAVVYGFSTIEAEVAESRLTLTGDPGALTRFASWFALPDKAAAP